MSKPGAGLFYLAALLIGSLAGCGEPPELELIAELEQGPGNITVTPDSRIFLSMHQFFNSDWRAAEWTSEGLREFPDPDIGASRYPEVPIDSVLGIQSDSQGIVWMLDNGMRGKVTPKLVAWDTRQDRLHKTILLPESAAPANAFVNDLVLDESRNRIYIADPAGGDNAALIVVNIQRAHARRVLQGHPSVVPEDMDLFIDGEPVEIKQADGTLVRPRVGVNPIALDANNEWLYYGPMHGTSLYRIRVDDLIDTTISPEALGKKVERFGRKPICDGISIDKRNNIYITDIENNAIGVIGKGGEYRIYLQDPRLSWPDALSFGPDNRLYTVSNQLHRTAVLHAGKQIAEPPYYIFSFKPLAGGVTGR